MMKWILIGAAVVVLPFVVMAVIGMFLPVGHRAVVRLKLPSASAQAVWALVSDIGAWPSWSAAVKKAERLPDDAGRPAWRIDDGGDALPSRVLEASAPGAGAPGRLRTEIIDDGLPFGGTWTWEVQPDGPGCSVTLTEDGKVYNPLFRFMSRFIFGHTATQTKYLAALARKMGETAQPEVL
jgi:hypothetical protein